MSKTLICPKCNQKSDDLSLLGTEHECPPDRSGPRAWLKGPGVFVMDVETSDIATKSEEELKSELRSRIQNFNIVLERRVSAGKSVSVPWLRAALVTARRRPDFDWIPNGE